MAIVVTDIANNANLSGATVAATVPVGGVPSSSLIVVVTGEEGSTEGGSVADTAGNTYNLAKSQQSGGVANIFGRIWYAYNCAALVSGNTITYTKQTSGVESAISAFYATGIEAGSDPYDTATDAGAPGSSTTPSVTSGTPAEAGELFVGVVAIGGEVADTFTQDSTNGAYATPPTRVGYVGAGSNIVVAGGNLVNSGSGALAYAPTLGTSRQWAALIASFKAASGAPPANTTNFFNFF